MSGYIVNPEIQQVLGPVLSKKFADFAKEPLGEIDVPDELPADIADKVRIDAEKGVLQFAPTQEDLDAWSALTDDHNVVHKTNSPEFTGGLKGPILHGNYIAALAETLARQYFEQHHKSKVKDYFDGSILGSIRRFFVRRGIIGFLDYKFSQAFRPGQQLELRVTDFTFDKANEETGNKDCMFKMACELTHLGSDAKGSINIDYLLRLPESPNLYDVLEKDKLEVTCTDTVVLTQEEADKYRQMVNLPGKDMPALFPVMRTNSKVLIKQFNELMQRRDFEFDTGFYHRYSIWIYDGARRLKLGDRLVAHYVPEGKLNPRGRQKVRIYVTDEENKVLYEFKAPIHLVKAVSSSESKTVLPVVDAELN
ncbi:MaoC family dehydratase [Candidatus Woesearchaeota archaeon]|nr:MaoC family dehydratase [Candidatus Woesearchaeota archaeon]